MHSEIVSVMKGGCEVVERSRNAVASSLGFLKRKYRTIILYSILGLIVISIGNCARNATLPEEASNFRRNRVHFEFLARELYSYFERAYENNNQLRSMSVLFSEDNWYRVYTYGQGFSYDREWISEEMSERKKNSAWHMIRGFHRHRPFAQIGVSYNKVEFWTYGGIFIVWTRDGRRPAFFPRFSDRRVLSIRRIYVFSSNWYICTITGHR